MLLVSAHWLALVGGVFLAFRYFRALGDVTQAIFDVTRDEVVAAAMNERRTLSAVSVCAVVALLTHLFGGVGNAVALAIGLTLSLVLAGFPWLWVHVGLRGRQFDARFFHIEHANRVLDENASVLVVEDGNAAWAFPDTEIRRPHIAGVPVSGGPTFTYCALSRLGIALRATSTELAVVGQYANNLILQGDERCIQQVYMGTPACTARFERVPVKRMSWRGFRHAFPQGKTFLNPMIAWFKNPFLRAFDEIIERVFNKALHAHHHEERLMFETMDYEDARLPRKTPIWGIAVGDSAAAFTEDYVRERGIVNTEVGNLAVVLAFDESVDALVAFERPLSQTVSRVDVSGHSDLGQLVPVATLYPGMYWFAWVNFFPETSLNGASQVPQELGHLHQATVG